MIECIADDSTECDCPRCERRQAEWEDDQGWDDDGAPDTGEEKLCGHGYFDPCPVCEGSCIDPAGCLCPHPLHGPDECFFGAGPDDDAAMGGKDADPFRNVWHDDDGPSRVDRATWRKRRTALNHLARRKRRRAKPAGVACAYATGEIQW